MSFFERDITLTVKLHVADAATDQEIAARIALFITNALVGGLNIPSISHAGELCRQIRVNAQPYKQIPVVSGGGVRTGKQEVLGT